MRYDQNTAAKGYRPVGKVVDLLEYRRWLAWEQAERWEEPESCEEPCVPEELEGGGEPYIPEYIPMSRPAAPRARRSQRRRRRELLLDLWASAAVLVMALTFTVRVLFF